MCRHKCALKKSFLIAYHFHLTWLLSIKLLFIIFKWFRFLPIAVNLHTLSLCAHGNKLKALWSGEIFTLFILETCWARQCHFNHRSPTNQNQEGVCLTLATLRAKAEETLIPVAMDNSVIYDLLLKAYHGLDLKLPRFLSIILAEHSKVNKDLTYMMKGMLV